MKKTVAIAFFLLAASPVWAGALTVQVVEGGQPNATKVVTLTDAEIDRIVSAFQGPANISVNGTATRAQVLNYWITQTLLVSTVASVLSFEQQKAIAALPVAVPINPQ